MHTHGDTSQGREFSPVEVADQRHHAALPPPGHGHLIPQHPSLDQVSEQNSVPKDQAEKGRVLQVGADSAPDLSSSLCACFPCSPLSPALSMNRKASLHPVQASLKMTLGEKAPRFDTDHLAGIKLPCSLHFRPPLLLGRERCSVVSHFGPRQAKEGYLGKVRRIGTCLFQHLSAAGPSGGVTGRGKGHHTCK